MADKPAKKPQVILKRQVTTKAVVTQKFKDFLFNELQENITFYRKRLAELTAQINSMNPADPSAMQLNKEKQEAQQYVSAEADQRKFITDLELKSLYSQGPVEGFVTVQVGDNIYEKLGGVEVIVEDGIVKKISTSPSQFDKVTKGSKVGA